GKGVDWPGCVAGGGGGYGEGEHGGADRRKRSHVKLVSRLTGGNTRQQRDQLLVIAGIERQLANLQSGDRAGGGGRLQIHLQRIRFDNHVFFAASHLEGRVDRQLVVNVEFNALLH